MREDNANLWDTDKEAWADAQILGMANAFGHNFTAAGLGMYRRQVLMIVSNNTEIVHPTLGKIRPGDWLFESILSTEEKFPKPIKLRMRWAKYWPSADGNEPMGVED